MRDFNSNFAKARDLCIKAKETNEAQDAWKLVDFMYDQLLTEKIGEDIQDSLMSFMSMLKSDLKILKNKEKYKNACISTSEEIIEGYIKELNDLIDFYFGE